MNIVYGCYPSYVSQYIANLLVRKYKLPITCILISEKDFVIERKVIKGAAGLMFFIRRFGFRYLLYHLILLKILPLCSLIAGWSKKEKVLSFNELSKEYQLSLIKTDDFNKKEIRQLLKKNKMDLFISMDLDQIIKHKFIDTARIDCINIHPSKLPDFRGPDPIFQIMLTSEKEMGVTLHRLTPQIDKGEIIIARTVEKQDNDTHLKLTFEFIHLGTEIIAEYVNKISMGRRINYLSQEDKKINYAYCSYPKRDEIILFNRSKLNYFLFQELGNYFSLSSQ